VPRRSSHITEFNPEALPEPPPPPEQRKYREPVKPGRASMIVLNSVLIAIAIVVGLMRFNTGRHFIRHALLATSAGLAHMADAPLLNSSPAAGPATEVPEAAKASPPPLVAAPKPEMPKAVVPLVSAGPAAAPSAAMTPLAAASPTAAPVAVASPTASQSPEVLSNPAPSAGPIAAEAPTAAMSPAAAASAVVPGNASAAPVAASTPITPPAPIVATTPAPPKPFDPADLVANPSAWPKQLRIRQAVEFPALYNGQVVGSVTAPPGTIVTLRNIQGGQLTVDYQGGTQKIPWTETDLEQEAAKVAATPPPAAPGPPTSATPPTYSAPPTSSSPPASSGLTAPTDTSSDSSSYNN